MTDRPLRIASLILSVLAFLADERRYQAVRALQLRNLVVPVVGDFSGPHALRAQELGLTPWARIESRN